MAPSFNSPKQELEQGICGQHGWSSVYYQQKGSMRWGVEVRWGAGPRNGHVFVSDDVSDAGSKAGVKKGHARRRPSRSRDYATSSTRRTRNRRRRLKRRTGRTSTARVP